MPASFLTGEAPDLRHPLPPSTYAANTAAATHPRIARGLGRNRRQGLARSCAGPASFPERRFPSRLAAQPQPCAPRRLPPRARRGPEPYSPGTGLHRGALPGGARGQGQAPPSSRRSAPRSAAPRIRSRSAATGRAGSMVAPRAVPPAGAVSSGRALFHGRQLLAELPLVSDLTSSLAPGLRRDGACDSPGRGFRPVPGAPAALDAAGSGMRGAG